MSGSNAVDIMQGEREGVREESCKNSPAAADAADAGTRARALALSGLGFGLAGGQRPRRSCARARSPPARCLRERPEEEQESSVSAESPMQERRTVMRCSGTLMATSGPVAGHTWSLLAATGHRRRG